LISPAVPVFGCLPIIKTITLIDQSEGVLAETAKKIRDLSIEQKVEIIQGDVFKDIPADHPFDSAVIGFLISHFTDDEMTRFLTLLKSSLARSGKFTVVDSVWGDEAKTHHRDSNGMATRRLYDGREFQIYKRYFSKEDFAEISYNNGLTIDIVYWGQVFFLAVGQFL
jgi:cyclopropane fatty-acyl-phospholipid synthase-like methyltransferase